MYHTQQLYVRFIADACKYQLSYLKYDLAIYQPSSTLTVTYVCFSDDILMGRSLFIGGV